MIGEELSDDYLLSLDEHLKQLSFRRGVLMSARLGKGNKGVSYLLRRTRNVPRTVRERLAAAVTRPPGYGFQIADRDEAGARALGLLRDRGLNSIANAAAQSSDHVLSFFRMLRAELGFYLGCLNLRDTLSAKGEPTTVPEPTTAEPPTLTFTNLRDVGLALRTKGPVVGNDVDADERTLLIVTGANQGGKSTFLRSVGLAQLMMQAGMFVVADTFRASVCSSVMTHFVREEDATMTSGKLDEELGRMSRLAERLTPCTLMLFNESFSATNEREGSEIARQIIRALRDAHIRVVFVTHMYDLAHGFYAAQDHSVLFLRAERLEDERRTFKIVAAEPERTSHGEDLYHRIFDAPDRPASPQNGGRRTAVTSQRTPA
jgi:DNA mismatch repair ATPase MutS